MTPMIGGLCRLSVVLAVSCPMVGKAEPAETMPRLDARRCGGGEEARVFLAALRVELAVLPVRVATLGRDATLDMGHAGAAEPDDVVHLSECQIRDGYVALTLGEETVSIDVTDVPPLARPRTAAVAVAETVRVLFERPGQVTSAVHTTPTQAPTDEPSPASVDTSATPPKEPLPSLERSDAPPPTQAADEATLPWEAGAALRVALLGPQQTVAWGATLSTGFRVSSRMRVELRTGYLTAGDEFAAGQARLHAAPVGMAAELTLGDATQGARPEVRLGAGIEALPVWVVVDSAYGFDEPAVFAFALWLDVRAAVVFELASEWTMSTGMIAAKDLQGVRLRATGEDGFSLYGLGLGFQSGVQRRF